MPNDHLPDMDLLKDKTNGLMKELGAVIRKFFDDDVSELTYHDRTVAISNALAHLYAKGMTAVHLSLFDDLDIDTQAYQRDLTMELMNLNQAKTQALAQKLGKGLREIRMELPPKEKP